MPYTRGPEFSRSVKEIVSEARQLIENGSKEIILLGQNVNAYNYNGNRLSDLLYALSEIEELKRIRYTTSHPKDMSKDLIEAHGKCEKLMPLLHLPIQSGSNKVLRNMNRGHSIEEYLMIVDKLKNQKPNIKFSSDFIIAYPEETKDDFKETLSLMNKIGFINSYSFIYSARPGTPAADMKKINEVEAKKRLKEFQNLADLKKKEYRKTLLNSKTKVLFENRIQNENKYFGRDEYQNSVITTSDKDLTGKIETVNITQFNNNTLFGEIFPKNKTGQHAA